MNLEVLKYDFSIFKIKSMDFIDTKSTFLFISKTDEEISVVSETKYVPNETISVENNWKCFRVEGSLDFSIIGVISEISNILAINEISIFVVSSYNTDYILVKSDKLEKSVKVLKENGYIIK